MPTKRSRPKTGAALVLAFALAAPHANAASMTSPISSTFNFTSQIIEGAAPQVVAVNHKRKHRRAGHGQSQTHQSLRRHVQRSEQEFRRRSNDRTRTRNGYRGSRHHRQGYRKGNDGWWYPLAAFAIGAIIIQQQNRQPTYRQNQSTSYRNWNHIPRGNMNAHDNWCDRKYRSYSRSSKTFQPYHGPRKFCNSPYDHL